MHVHNTRARAHHARAPTRARAPCPMFVRALCVQVNFYEGPPFKFKGTAKSHERFPNCVRSPPAREAFLALPLPLTRSLTLTRSATRRMARSSSPSAPTRCAGARRPRRAHRRHRRTHEHTHTRRGTAAPPHRRAASPPHKRTAAEAAAAHRR